MQLGSAESEHRQGSISYATTDPAKTHVAKAFRVEDK